MLILQFLHRKKSYREIEAYMHYMPFTIFKILLQSRYDVVLKLADKTIIQSAFFVLLI